MLIGIDARLYKRGGGIGRYVERLIFELEKLDNINKYYIFLRADNWDAYQPVNPNFSKVLADFRWYTLKEQIFLPRIIKKLNLDLMHFTNFNVPLFFNRPYVVTIHDLILIRFPQSAASTLSPIKHFIKLLGYNLTIKHAVSAAKKVVTVSNSSKQDLKEIFKINDNKIVVTYEAAFTKEVMEKNYINFESVRAKYKLPDKYILYIGNQYPHKNVELILNLAAKQKTWQFVLVGQNDYFFQRNYNYVKQNNLKNIIMIGDITDKELRVILKNAFCYIFPSFIEGFGIPGLEAMQCGTPVVCSNIRCLREIYGSAALYFDPSSTTEAIYQIERLNNSHALVKKHIELGFEKIRQYSWSDMAKKTLEIYKTMNK